MAGKKQKTETVYKYRIDSEGVNRRYPSAQWECPHCKEWNPAKHTQCNSCKKGIARADDYSNTVRDKIPIEDESIVEEKNESSPMHLAMAARYQPMKMGHETTVEAKFSDKYAMNLPRWVVTNRVRDRTLKVRSAHDLTKIAEVYEVAGETLSRAEVMGKIVEGVASGVPLVSLLKSDPGWPDPLDVRVWRRRYPKFDEDLKEAEKVFGDILYEQGLHVAMNSRPTEPVLNRDGEVIGERTNAQILKLQVETLQAAASKFNEKYLDKQIQQVEDITDRMTREEMLDRLKQLMNENPELKEVMPDIVEGEVVKDEA